MNSRVLHNLKHSISFRRARFKMKQTPLSVFVSIEKVKQIKIVLKETDLQHLKIYQN